MTALQGREGTYSGHFIVPVCNTCYGRRKACLTAAQTGYSSTHVFYHDPGDSAGAHKEVLRERFDAARRATGTDEDCLILTLGEPVHV